MAVNDLREEVVFADIKLDSSMINLKALKEKASKAMYNFLEKKPADALSSRTDS